MINVHETITSARQANLMITDIDNAFDATRWINKMMEAIRNGVEFHKTETFCEVQALIHEYEKQCKRKGIKLAIEK